MSQPIRRLLIANRGEIAMRILRGATDAGIECVAAVSEIDRDLAFAVAARKCVVLGEAAPSKSYLNIDRIIAAAKETESDAIHPGYGFLAENADFAERVEAAGLIFVGPTPEAIRTLGDKASARALAVKAGVPIAPGSEAMECADQLVRIVEQIGLPVLLKPAAGGGGKGMQVVEEGTDIRAAIEGASRVAKSAFGDARLIAERLIRPARHVEVQIFGDGCGEVVALGERECSLQRRHQKIVEESPSPVVGEKLRATMSEAAIALGRSCNYRGAGTVEFLLDADQKFYFLEVNTRLQVEHPVTEEVYGVDLVRAQLQVAEGGGIPESLRTATPRGHSIEVRISAEDAEQNFIPSPGTILASQVPQGPGIRWDAGFEGSGVISPDYDPMIAKLIVWGQNRVQAIERLRRALRETEVLGVTTNLTHLSMIADSDWFSEGDFHTGTVEGQGRMLLTKSIPDAVVAAAAWMWTHSHQGVASQSSAASEGSSPDPFETLGDWRAHRGSRS